MKKIFFVFFVGFLIVSGQFKSDKYEMADNLFEKTISQSKIEILSNENMKIMNGGCGGGGTCSYYFHTCSLGCTHMSAYSCAGSVGTCINAYMNLICVCGSRYDFIPGC